MHALVRLFDYDYWANSRIIDLLIKRGITDDQLLQWMNHIVNMEEIWLLRCKEEDSYMSLKTQRPLTTLLLQTQSLHREYCQMVKLRTDEQLDEYVSYRNQRGMAFSMPLRDILTHVINHSTHHRGQIVAGLRSAGFVPPVTDYIHFVQYAKV
ncbi:MAG: DinB family protein [Bacteroidota bacterium]